jgi:hypothetical protein
MGRSGPHDFRGGGRLARCATRLAGRLRAFRRGHRKKRGRAPAFPNKKSAESKAHKPPNPLRLALCSLPLYRAGVAAVLNFLIAQGMRLPRHPKIKEITNSTRNIKNRSLAMPADAAAIPPNPKTAATSAMIRNTTAQANISSPPHRLDRICRLTRAPLHTCSRLIFGTA